jgi:hypothetical protein
VEEKALWRGAELVQWEMKDETYFEVYVGFLITSKIPDIT